MTELFDSSRIPDDPAHWDALAQRVAERARRSAHFDWAQSRAGWLAASLLLAGALAYGFLPRDEARLSLAPSDRLGQVFSTGDGPPDLAALLLGGKGG